MGSREAVCNLPPTGFIESNPLGACSPSYGASVDGDGDYVIVEKEYRVWFLFYDGDMEYCCMLDSIQFICEVYLVSTKPEWISYVVDDTGLLRRLVWYRWDGVSWVHDGPYEAVDHSVLGVSEGLVVDLGVDISGVYENCSAHNTVWIVV